ncbi:hypothetical protein VARIO8X_160061 [Burkholderiales bacterium 8X]|nr:hypothetical protein VARIO8X_160061 [Burkholderiales bacterium 8X]
MPKVSRRQHANEHRFADRSLDSARRRRPARGSRPGTDPHRRRHGGGQRAGVLRLRDLRVLRGLHRPDLLPRRHADGEPAAVGGGVRRRLLHPAARRHPDRRLCRPRRAQAGDAAYDHADHRGHARAGADAFVREHRIGGADHRGGLPAGPGPGAGRRGRAGHRLPGRGGARRQARALCELAAGEPGCGGLRRRPGRHGDERDARAAGHGRLGLARAFPGRAAAGAGGDLSAPPHAGDAACQPAPRREQRQGRAGSSSSADRAGHPDRAGRHRVQLRRQLHDDLCHHHAQDVARHRSQRHRGRRFLHDGVLVGGRLAERSLRPQVDHAVAARASGVRHRSGFHAAGRATRHRHAARGVGGAGGAHRDQRGGLAGRDSGAAAAGHPGDRHVDCLCGRRIALRRHHAAVDHLVDRHHRQCLGARLVRRSDQRGDGDRDADAARKPRPSAGRLTTPKDEKEERNLMHSIEFAAVRRQVPAPKEANVR